MSQLAEKMAEEMATAIVMNKEVKSHTEAALTFFSCIGIQHSVSSSPQMDIEACGDKFIVDTVGRSLLDVLKEVCLRSYYSKIIK
ncbi:hypothetical protein [Morganella morganii]|uniref:hypothetical protein n=1 Tax=Morganella morganii TaxID=582 RepID=UPI003EB8824B